MQAERFVSSQFVLSGISPDQVFTRRQLEAISGFYVMRCSGVCVCLSYTGPGPEILMSPCIPKRGRGGERGEAGRGGGGGGGGWEEG